MATGPRAGGDTTSPESSLMAGASARVQHLYVVHTPDDRGRELALRTAADVAELAVGREPRGAKTLAIADARISRQHAVLRRDPVTGDISVMDCGSRHGTVVDGMRLEPAGQARLSHGSVLRLGDSVLVLADARLSMNEAKALAPETAALLGASFVMQRVRGEIALVAPRPLPVLILGETGVGKERVAEEVHRQSGRVGSFVAINCAAIAPTLAETELFGHAAGAFTGATQKSDGVFVAADKGTLFLDEIAELPPALQPKLLRALATGEVRPVGRAEARRVDVRLVAATHGDLDRAVDEGGFREDLLARLAGWTLRVPPLRDRREDILRLARVFLARHDTELRLSASSAEALVLHAWRFNVRELEQVLAAAVIRVTDGVLRPEHLPEAIARPVLARAAERSDPPQAPLEALVAPDAVPDADGLRLVANQFHGNIALVASYFGKDRKQVYRWAEKLGVDLDSLRETAADRERSAHRESNK